MPIAACPFCNAEAKYAFQTNHHSVWRCGGRCGHYFALHPRPEQGHCEYLSDACPSQAYQQRDRRLVHYLLGKIAVRGQARVVDIGCGDGHLAAAFSEAGCDVTGVEPVREARRLVEKRGIRALGDVSEIPEDERFDLACLVEVIEHLQSPVDVLKSIRPHLGRGGKLFLTTPSASGLKARFKRSQSGAYFSPHHLHFFTPRSLRMCLAKAGFESTETLFLPFYVPNRKPLRLAAARLLDMLGLGAGITVIAEVGEG